MHPANPKSGNSAWIASWQSLTQITIRFRSDVTTVCSTPLGFPIVIVPYAGSWQTTTSLYWSSINLVYPCSKHCRPQKRASIRAKNDATSTWTFVVSAMCWQLVLETGFQAGLYQATCRPSCVVAGLWRRSTSSISTGVVILKANALAAGAANPAQGASCTCSNGRLSQ